MKWHGSNWIRKAKRERIHRRDDWRCVWCREFVFSKAVIRLSDGAETRLACLDHVVPRSRGGGNHSGNLVTACKRCNDSRGAKDPMAFAATFRDTAAVLARIIRSMGSVV